MPLSQAPEDECHWRPGSIAHTPEETETNPIIESRSPSPLVLVRGSVLQNADSPPTPEHLLQAA